MARSSIRERLTAPAFELFDERGYEHSTVDDIADAARVVLLHYLGKHSS